MILAATKIDDIAAKTRSGPTRSRTMTPIPTSRTAMTTPPCQPRWLETAAALAAAPPAPVALAALVALAAAWRRRRVTWEASISCVCVCVIFSFLRFCGETKREEKGARLRGSSFRGLQAPRRGHFQLECVIAADDANLRLIKQRLISKKLNDRSNAIGGGNWIRISREDSWAGPGGSVANQRRILFRSISS